MWVPGSSRDCWQLGAAVLRDGAASPTAASAHATDTNSDPGERCGRLHGSKSSLTRCWLRPVLLIEWACRWRLSRTSVAHTPAVHTEGRVAIHHQCPSSRRRVTAAPGGHEPAALQPVSCRAACGRNIDRQWLPLSSPLSAPCILALCSLSPMISTVLPRAAYLVVMASRAATDEASQTCAEARSMMTLSGSFA